MALTTTACCGRCVDVEQLPCDCAERLEGEVYPRLGPPHYYPECGRSVLLSAVQGAELRAAKRAGWVEFYGCGDGYVSLPRSPLLEQIAGLAGIAGKPFQESGLAMIEDPCGIVHIGGLWLQPRSVQLSG